MSYQKFTRVRGIWSEVAFNSIGTRLSACVVLTCLWELNIYIFNFFYIDVRNRCVTDVEKGSKSPVWAPMVHEVMLFFFCSMRKLDVAYRILPCRRAAQYSHSHALMLRHVAESTLSINALGAPGIWDCTQFQFNCNGPRERERYSRGGLRMTTYLLLQMDLVFQQPKGEPITTKVQNTDCRLLPAN